LRIRLQIYPNSNLRSIPQSNPQSAIRNPQFTVF
jgi:hypothetical protein